MSWEHCEPELAAQKFWHDAAPLVWQKGKHEDPAEHDAKYCADGLVMFQKHAPLLAPRAELIHPLRAHWADETCFALNNSPTDWMSGANDKPERHKPQNRAIYKRLIYSETYTSEDWEINSYIGMHMNDQNVAI